MRLTFVVRQLLARMVMLFNSIEQIMRICTRTAVADVAFADGRNTRS